MNLLGVDVGTTHVKAGLFGMEGAVLSIAARPTPVQRPAGAPATIDPLALWQAVSTAIREVIQAGAEAPVAIGVAGMAETGLLVDRESGEPVSPCLPWFDTASQPQAERLAAAGDPVERFCRTGIRPTFKCSLAKLLWLIDQGITTVNPAVPTVWLCAPDWIVYCLTGVLQTDLSLAGRTYAFDLDRKEWDTPWLERFGLGPERFPRVLTGGAFAGGVRLDGRFLPNRELGLKEGTPVSVCGHDHICGAFAAGAVDAGDVFDSMGTAETLLGVLEDRPLTDQDYRSGLSFGSHVLPGRRYWLGGISTSGGSLEWLRRILGDHSLTYTTLDAWMDSLDDRPGSVLFFPYLAGSGSPHSDPAVRGAFVGLSAAHERSDLLKAVLEGTAYELEWIRREAEATFGQPIYAISAAGGGTRNRHWMQIKANVSGIPFTILPQAESTLLGAALLAGIGAGIFADDAAAVAGLRLQEAQVVEPEAVHHNQYRQIYEGGYLAFQEPLRRWAHLPKHPPTEAK